jgi:hypothetical protein
MLSPCRVPAGQLSTERGWDRDERGQHGSNDSAITSRGVCRGASRAPSQRLTYSRGKDDFKIGVTLDEPCHCSNWDGGGALCAAGTRSAEGHRDAPALRVVCYGLRGAIPRRCCGRCSWGDGPGPCGRFSLSFGFLPTRSLFQLFFPHRHDKGISIGPRPHRHLVPGDGH